MHQTFDTVKLIILNLIKFHSVFEMGKDLVVCLFYSLHVRNATELENIVLSEPETKSRRRMLKFI
jgi:hypothetical protein